MPDKKKSTLGKSKGLFPDYIKNFSKSAALFTGDMIQDLIPATREIKEENEETVNELIEKFQKTQASIARTTKKFNSTTVNKEITGLLNNIKEDIKTGKFYNKERIDKKQMSSFGGDFDFDFDDNTESGGDEFNFDSSDNSVNVLNVENNIDDENFEALGESINNTIVDSVKANITNDNKNANYSYLMSLNNHKETVGYLNNINDNLVQLVTYANENLNPFFETATSFFENQLKANETIIQHLSALNVYGTNNKNSKKSNVKSLFKDNNIFNIKSYWEELQSKMGMNSMIFSMPSMIASVLGIESNEEGDYSESIIKAFENSKLYNSPISFITSTLFKTLMPGQTKGKLRDLNTNIGNLPSTLLKAFNELGEKMDDNNLLKPIFNFLGFSRMNKTKGNYTRYNKNPVPFDGITRNAIITVIPNLLSKIYSAIIGEEDELVYNYNTGKFESSKNLRKEISEIESGNTGDNKEELEYREKFKSDFITKEDVLKKIKRENQNSQFGDLSHIFDNFGFENSEIRKLLLYIGTLETNFNPSENNKENLEKLSEIFGTEKRARDFINTYNNLDSNKKFKLADLATEEVRNRENSIKYKEENAQESGLMQAFSMSNNITGFKNRGIKHALDKQTDTIISIINGIRRILINGIIVYPREFDKNKFDGFIKSLNLGEIDEYNSYKNGNTVANQIKTPNQAELNKEAKNVSKDEIEKTNQETEDRVRKEYEAGQTAVENLTKGFKNTTASKGLRRILEFVQKPYILIDKGIDKLNKMLGDFFYGKNSKENDEGLVKRLSDSFKKTVDRIGKYFNHPIKRLKEFLKGKKEEIADKLFGKLDKDGKRDGTGILSALSGELKLRFKSLDEAIFGTQYEDPETKKKKRNRTGSIVGYVKESFDDVFSSFKKYVFGEKEVDENGNVIKKKGMFSSLREKFNNAFSDLYAGLFGEENKKKFDIGGKLDFDDLKEKFKKYLPDGIFGGSLGLIGSLFLPGGPLLGATVGALTNIGLKTGKLKEILVGNEEKSGIFGAKFSKFFNETISPEWKKAKGKIIGNAGLGVIGSLFLPGGPLLGGLIGAFTGLAQSSDKFKEFLFGKTDENGNIVRKGILPKEAPAAIKKVFNAGSIGLVTSMFLPGGPIVGAITTTLLSVIPTKKIKTFFWGDYDKETGKGRKGIFQKLGGYIGRTILKPFKSLAEYQKNAFKQWFDVMIKDNIKLASKALKLMVKKGIAKVGNFLKKVSDKFLKESLIGKWVNNLLIKPLRGLVSGIGKTIRGVISAPFRAIGNISRAYLNANQSNLSEKDKQFLDESAERKRAYRTNIKGYKTDYKDEVNEIDQENRDYYKDVKKRNKFSKEYRKYYQQSLVDLFNSGRFTEDQIEQLFSGIRNDITLSDRKKRKQTRRLENFIANGNINYNDLNEYLQKYGNDFLKKYKQNVDIEFEKLYNKKFVDKKQQEKIAEDQKIKDFSTQLGTTIGDKIKESLGDSINDEDIEIIGKNIIDNIYKGIKDNYKNNKLTDQEVLKNIGESIVDGVKEGIVSKSDTELSKAVQKYIVDKVTIAIREGFDIHSPSKKMEEMGENISQGLADGIKNKKDEVENAVDEINDTIKNKIENKEDEDEELGWISKKIQKKLQPIKDTFEKIGKVINIILHPVKALKKLKEGFKGIGKVFGLDKLKNFHPIKSAKEKFSNIRNKFKRFNPFNKNDGENYIESELQNRQDQNIFGNVVGYSDGNYDNQLGESYVDAEIQKRKDEEHEALLSLSNVVKGMGNKDNEQDTTEKKKTIFDYLKDIISFFTGDGGVMSLLSGGFNSLMSFLTGGVPGTILAGVIAYKYNDLSNLIGNVWDTIKHIDDFFNPPDGKSFFTKLKEAIFGTGDKEPPKVPDTDTGKSSGSDGGKTTETKDTSVDGKSLDDKENTKKKNKTEDTKKKNAVDDVKDDIKNKNKNKSSSTDTSSSTSKTPDKSFSETVSDIEKNGLSLDVEDQSTTKTYTDGTGNTIKNVPDNITTAQDTKVNKLLEETLQLSQESNSISDNLGGINKTIDRATETAKGSTELTEAFGAVDDAVGNNSLGNLLDESIGATNLSTSTSGKLVDTSVETIEKSSNIIERLTEIWKNNKSDNFADPNTSEYVQSTFKNIFSNITESIKSVFLSFFSSIKSGKINEGLKKGAEVLGTLFKKWNKLKEFPIVKQVLKKLDLLGNLADLFNMLMGVVNAPETFGEFNVNSVLHGALGAYITGKNSVHDETSLMNTFGQLMEGFNWGRRIGTLNSTAGLITTPLLMAYFGLNSLKDLEDWHFGQYYKDHLGYFYRQQGLSNKQYVFTDKVPSWYGYVDDNKIREDYVDGGALFEENLKEFDRRHKDDPINLDKDSVAGRLNSVYNKDDVAGPFLAPTDENGKAQAVYKTGGYNPTKEEIQASKTKNRKPKTGGPIFDDGSTYGNMMTDAGTGQPITNLEDYGITKTKNKWGLPLKSGSMSQDFTTLRAVYTLRAPGDYDHSGIDLAAATDTPVYSTADGIVKNVTDGYGNNRGSTGMASYGNYIDVYHGNGYFTRYAHLNKGSMKVQAGDSVRKGQQIAGLGNSGNSTGPHLHFEVHDQDKPRSGDSIDPKIAVFGPDKSYAQGLLNGLNTVDESQLEGFDNTSTPPDMSKYKFTNENVNDTINSGDWTTSGYNNIESAYNENTPMGFVRKILDGISNFAANVFGIGNGSSSSSSSSGSSYGYSSSTSGGGSYSGNGNKALVYDENDVFMGLSTDPENYNIENYPHYYDHTEDEIPFGYYQRYIDEFTNRINPKDVTGSDFGGDTSKQSFINDIDDYSVKLSYMTGIKPSLAMAQTILESGWGSKPIGNNYHGRKAYSSWLGPRRDSKTKEEVNGSMINTTGTFKDYFNMYDSFVDYYNLINGDRYTKVRQANDYKEATQAVKDAGYATDSEYPSKLNNIIEDYGLYKYDELAKKDLKVAGHNNDTSINKTMARQTNLAKSGKIDKNTPQMMTGGYKEPTESQKRRQEREQMKNINASLSNYRTEISDEIQKIKNANDIVSNNINTNNNPSNDIPWDKIIELLERLNESNEEISSNTKKIEDIKIPEMVTTSVGTETKENPAKTYVDNRNIFLGQQEQKRKEMSRRMHSYVEQIAKGE